MKKIDLKQAAFEQPLSSEKAGKKPKGRKKWLKISIFSFIFLFTSLFFFSNQVMVSDQESTSWISNLPFIRHVKQLVESADRSLKGENLDRINILLLGMGGVRHEGGYLTDTIILASLEPSAKKASLISIPRDMAVPVEDLGWQKINHINAYAEIENEDSGGLAVSQAVSDILDIPIDYYVRVDFQGFINIVDELGGLEVEVENALNDYAYPIMGREDAEPYESRFEHLYIEAGTQTMDGKLALKYARSRHAAGIEGSDFARAKRQQQIILAAKNKLLSAETIFNPKKISDIIGEYQSHVSTNLKIWEMIKLWDMFKDVGKSDIVNRVIDNSPGGLLVDEISEQGAYILVPRSGDFSEIQYFIKNIFSEAPQEMRSSVDVEKAAIEVRNGTWINGLASKVTLDLERYGFIIIRIGNSSKQNFQKSVIYDLTYGEKPKSLEILKNKTGANVAYGLPQWLIDEISIDLENEKNPIKPDFVLILGQDADSTDSGKENSEEETE